MGADDADDQDHEHVWRLARMLVDGRGTFFEESCVLCPAVAVSPASGEVRPRRGPEGPAPA